MILVLNWIFIKNFKGITLFPFVILKDKSLKHNKILINHEKIHLKQQLELLVLGFYIWYVLEFLTLYIKFKDWDLAYRNISFEKEAYTNESNPHYITNRPFWAFLKYFPS